VRRAIAFAGAAAALAASCALAADAVEPRAVSLMRDAKCYICHADDEALAGPSFADVAAAYRGRRNAVATIAAFVRRGEHGPFPWHMPPHPELSAADATAIARYIVSLDERSPAPGSEPREGDQPASATSPRS
jgi:sulfite dehydrogenase